MRKVDKAWKGGVRKGGVDGKADSAVGTGRKGVGFSVPRDLHPSRVIMNITRGTSSFVEVCSADFSCMLFGLTY